MCADYYAADGDHAGVGDGGYPADRSLALALDCKNIEKHKQAVDRAGGAGVSAGEGLERIGCAEEGFHLFLGDVLTVDNIPAGEIVKSADCGTALAVHCAVTHTADGLLDCGDNAVGNSCNAEHRNREHNELTDRFLGVVPYGEGCKEGHKTREEHRYALEE